MAENIISGLFGLTPNQYNTQRNAQLEQSAHRYAQLDPFERANMAIYEGGARLAKPIAGLFGYVDPEEERINKTQQMMAGVDFNSTEGLMAKAQQFMDAGDYRTAYGLTQLAQQRRASEADLATKRAQEAKAMKEGLTSEQRNAAARADTEVQRGTPEWTASYGKYLAELTAKNTSPDLVRTYEYAVKNGYKGSIEDWKRAGSTNVQVKVNSELKQAPDVVKSVHEFDTAIKPYKEAYEDAQLSKRLINDAKESNNSQSWEAARTTLAKSLEPGKLSNDDIRRTGTDPRLVQGAMDWVSKKTTGVPNDDIMKQLYALATIIERHNETQINTKANRARQAAKASNFGGDPDVYFPTATPQGATDWANLKKK